MVRYHTFFTNLEGEQEIGGSHFDLMSMSRSIELFLQANPRRQFASVAACVEEDGEITELARWNKGSVVPVFDIREEFLAKRS